MYLWHNTADENQLRFITANAVCMYFHKSLAVAMTTRGTGCGSNLPLRSVASERNRFTLFRVPWIVPWL
jgi:hypothetical protein